MFPLIFGGIAFALGAVGIGVGVHTVNKASNTARELGNDVKQIATLTANQVDAITHNTFGVSNRLVDIAEDTARNFNRNSTLITHVISFAIALVSTSITRFIDMCKNLVFGSMMLVLIGFGLYELEPPLYITTFLYFFVLFILSIMSYTYYNFAQEMRSSENYANSVHLQMRKQMAIAY